MSFYLSDIDGTGGRLKTEPEDFIVKEISVLPDVKENGRHVIAEITCRNWETNRLIRLMARNLGISREKIGFAGTKDKRAVTTQLMSFECSMDTFRKLDLKDIEVGNAYIGKRPIQIGDLIGNSFDIKVKDCNVPSADIGSILERVTSDVKATGGFPNYFGVQRFGVIRPITHKVGRSIVKGDIEGAVRCYLSDPSSFENEETQEARKRLCGSENWQELYEMTPDSLSFEKIMVGHLASNPDDWKGAIELLPRNLQMMFIHAYQSYLFNIMLSKRMEAGIPINSPSVGDIIIPLNSDRIPLHENPISVTSNNIDLVTRQVRAKRAFITITLFGSEEGLSSGEMGEIERSVIRSEDVTGSDFIIPELPNCSSKGSRREIICPVNDLSTKIEDDGYRVGFSLPKGNYATCLMREFMKSDMNRY